MIGKLLRKLSKLVILIFFIVLVAAVFLLTPYINKILDIDNNNIVLNSESVKTVLPVKKEPVNIFIKTSELVNNNVIDIVKKVIMNSTSYNLLDRSELDEIIRIQEYENSPEFDIVKAPQLAKLKPAAYYLEIEPEVNVVNDIIGKYNCRIILKDISTGEISRLENFVYYYQSYISKLWGVILITGIFSVSILLKYMSVFRNKLKVKNEYKELLHEDYVIRSKIVKELQNMIFILREVGGELAEIDETKLLNKANETIKTILNLSLIVENAGFGLPDRSEKDRLANLPEFDNAFLQDIVLLKKTILKLPYTVSELKFKLTSAVILETNKAFKRLHVKFGKREEYL